MKMTSFGTLLAVKIGINEAIFLNQVLFWISKSGKSVEGHTGKWVYNTLRAWHKQFPFWSLITLRRTIKSLEDQGILKTAKIRAESSYDNTKFYSIDEDKITGILCDQNEHIDVIKMSADVIKMSTDVIKMSTSYKYHNNNNNNNNKRFFSLSCEKEEVGTKLSEESIKEEANKFLRYLLSKEYEEDGDPYGMRCRVDDEVLAVIKTTTPSVLKKRIFLQHYLKLI